MAENVTDVMHELSEGQAVEINTHNQTFTVTDTMFGGEIIELEGPRGGEKSLVENVNSGSVSVMNGDRKEGTLTEINV